MSRSWTGRIVGLLSIVAAFDAELAHAQSPSPEDVLKKAGLTRSKGYYVLSGEAEVQRKVNEARLRWQQLKFAITSQEAFEVGAEGQKTFAEELMERRAWLIGQLAAIDQQLSAFPSVVAANTANGQAVMQLTNARRSLAAELDAVTFRIRMLSNQQAADPELKRQISAELTQRRGAYMEAILELRQLVDKTNGQYTELKKDDKITKALEALGSKLKSKSPLKLGPSSQFLDNVGRLEKAEKLVRTDKVELRRNRGGVDEVDVTIGKQIVPMIFDTGAAVTAISTDLAARLGLKPKPSDPTIELKVANGAAVQAKLITIPSMRVGIFTVNDVACAVVPPGAGEVHSLLGQSFHRHFTYKYSPGGGEVVISKVGPEEPKTRVPASTKSTKKVGRRGRSVPYGAQNSSDPF